MVAPPVAPDDRSRYEPSVALASSLSASNDARTRRIRCEDWCAVMSRQGAVLWENSRLETGRYCVADRDGVHAVDQRWWNFLRSVSTFHDAWRSVWVR